MESTGVTGLKRVGSETMGDLKYMRQQAAVATEPSVKRDCNVELGQD